LDGRAAHSYTYVSADQHLTSLPAALTDFIAAADINRLFAEAESNGGAAPIPIPPGDPLFAQFKDGAALQGGRAALNFTRSQYVM
jgi:hypothetical protein